MSSTLKKLAQYAISAALLVMPAPVFHAAAADALPTVNTAPRFALVFGNGKYPTVPLKNAPNDAKAIADQLKRMGFDVTIKLDATRSEMVETIRAFGSTLQKQKGVGLFYFAGHGAQLAWRNYLIPVDAQIKNAAEIDAQAVDMDMLLESMTRAKNPMNLIILDACRDNPFGGDVQMQQKGLSQVDAPPGTLLAYATAPGNTAADGLGANGLYTENVLKEMQAPAAKLEDIFKRVRLNVRLQSKGQQIPWESTSLEQDFYFRPPKDLKNLSLTETEQQFQDEFAVWEGIQDSTEPAPLEDYLRRYPSGKFSEFAQ
ncbi:MAG: caspase family protein, partial [Betaproteobacteria bacterium]